jgi:hypothetical protein
MSMVDRWGVQIKLTVARKPTTTDAEKTRDIALCRMRRVGQSWRTIGVVLGLTHEGARKRWYSLPEAVREHYGRAEVG